MIDCRCDAGDDWPRDASGRFDPPVGTWWLCNDYSPCRGPFQTRDAADEALAARRAAGCTAERLDVLQVVSVPA